ncbi:MULTISPECIES: serine/threonine protein kinase [Streptomyces]|uniref:Serine-threonine protein kinase n=1 Tax=Streptomyces griseofuscus TaxID=146922 RepID=A0A7H1Q7P7_9ACTN|nr:MULTISPECIES: serine/threonine protein kinase [Streptomyces]QNT96327.1 serine-threonine protein kinase [Streptomyces griseofuscus]BBC96950.1 serine-threonine protein kinase [Streptomyces rochei]
MADSGMSVSPYWELTFDASGDVDPPERDHLLAQVTEQGVRDLVVFAHGWNEDRSAATALYRRFFAPFPGLAPRAHLGYVGVVWPSMRFSDEPIPDFPRSVVATDAAPGPALDQDTRRRLLIAFPGRADVIDQVARLLDERPDGDAGLTEFGRLVRLLADGAGSTAADTDEDGEPAVFTEETATACAEFAGALAAVAAPGGTEGFSLPNPWEGAKELLRQAAYYQMKGRAGTIGEHGLGPLLGKLAAKAPGVRVHLVGHSFGGRLVAFALRGLPGQARPVKSLTLLEGAFSHYVFADRLPDDPHKSGALKDQQRRIDGPLVCCHSHFDAALGTFYPLASRLAGDDRSCLGNEIAAVLGPRWGALGHDGVQAVPGTARLDLAGALAGRLPASGCVNVDAAAVVRRGGPPAGAHSDILHPELARVVLAAGRIA